MDTRTQLKISVIVALLGIVGLAAFGWRSLDRSSTAAEQLRQQLERIRVVARLEEALHALEDLPESPESAQLVEDLSQRTTDLAQMDWGDRDLQETARKIGVEVEHQRGLPPRQRSWSRAEQLASRIEKRAIRGSLDQFNEDAEKQARRARDLAQLGALTALLFSVLASVTYLRLRRERTESIRRLRHNDRLAALGTIAATMAHELNNPLATIAGCSAAIGDRLRRNGADADSLEYIAMVEDETRRCTGLVNGLRDLARDRPLAVTFCNLSQLAEDVAGLIRLDRTDKAVVVQINAAPAAELMCDPDKIKQLLLNLIVNARDASAEGDTIRIRVARRASHILLEVEDEGQGIARKELPRIFEAFHTGKTRGLGIGLFLCKRIVDLHGGTISVHSAGLGKGARFEISLPTRLGSDSQELAMG